MELEKYIPVWAKLLPEQRERLEASAVRHSAAAGTLIHGGGADCTGLLLIEQGQLRAYILSEEGREITLYRLLERDICLFSASCMLRSAQFDIMIRAERDTVFLSIPAETFKEVSEQSAPLANFTNEIMSARFTEVMWLLEQLLWKSFDRRLAGFLLEESALEGTNVLKTTHEEIGSHLGNPREVVTRMLRYFSSEGLVQLSRGHVTILEKDRLEKLRDGEA